MVRNHAGGTRETDGICFAEAAIERSFAGVDAHQVVDGGEFRRRLNPLSLHGGIGGDAPDESHGSQARYSPGETGALNESEDHRGRFRPLRKETRNTAYARTLNVSR